MRNPFSIATGNAGGLRIGLAQNGIALIKTGRRSQSGVLGERALSSEQTATPEALAQALGKLLSDTRCANQPASIILADQWVRLFMVTPPQNTASLRDCQAAAAMRFQDLYGDSISAWEVDADWQAKQAFLACAMPTKMLAALRQIAVQHRLTLISIVPQFIAAWNQWSDVQDGSSWFGIAYDNVLTLAAVDQNRLHAVRAIQAPRDAWQNSEWISTHLAREALRLNLPVPKQLQICGQLAVAASGQAVLPAFCNRLDVAQTAPDGGPRSAALLLAQTGVRSRTGKGVGPS